MFTSHASGKRGRRVAVVESADPVVGRPRQPQLDDVILSAALKQLATKGYSRMSLDAVAAAAGVSKPTIYRRWRSKAELACAAIGWNIDVEAESPDESSTKDSLIRILSNIRERLLGLNGMRLVGTVLAEEKQTPELIGLFRGRVMNRRIAMARNIMQAANARKELRAAADLNAAVNMLIGSMYAVYLAEGSIPRDWPKRVVATLWRGIGVRAVS